MDGPGKEESWPHPKSGWRCISHCQRHAPSLVFLYGTSVRLEEHCHTGQQTLGPGIWGGLEVSRVTDPPPIRASPQPHEDITRTANKTLGWKKWSETGRRRFSEQLSKLKGETCLPHAPQCAHILLSCHYMPHLSRKHFQSIPGCFAYTFRFSTFFP